MQPVSPEISPDVHMEAVEQFKAMHPEVDSEMDIHQAQLQVKDLHEQKNVLYWFQVLF